MTLFELYLALLVTLTTEHLRSYTQKLSFR